MEREKTKSLSLLQNSKRYLSSNALRKNKFGKISKQQYPANLQQSKTKQRNTFHIARKYRKSVNLEIIQQLKGGKLEPNTCHEGEKEKTVVISLANQLSKLQQQIEFQYEKSRKLQEIIKIFGIQPKIRRKVSQKVTAQLPQQQNETNLKRQKKYLRLQSLCQSVSNESSILQQQLLPNCEEDVKKMEKFIYSCSLKINICKNQIQNIKKSIEEYRKERVLNSQMNHKISKSIKLKQLMYKDLLLEYFCLASNFNQGGQLLLQQDSSKVYKTYKSIHSSKSHRKLKNSALKNVDAVQQSEDDKNSDNQNTEIQKQVNKVTRLEKETIGKKRISCQMLTQYPAIGKHSPLLKINKSQVLANIFKTNNQDLSDFMSDPDFMQAFINTFWSKVELQKRDARQFQNYTQKLTQQNNNLQQQIKQLDCQIFQCTNRLKKARIEHETKIVEQSEESITNYQHSDCVLYKILQSQANNIEDLWTNIVQQGRIQTQIVLIVQQIKDMLNCCEANQKQYQQQQQQQQQQQMNKYNDQVKQKQEYLMHYNINDMNQTKQMAGKQQNKIGRNQKSNCKKQLKKSKIKSKISWSNKCEQQMDKKATQSINSGSYKQQGITKTITNKHIQNKNKQNAEINRADRQRGKWAAFNWKGSIQRYQNLFLAHV